MPPQFQAWRESWMAKHPDWKFMLWTEAEAKEIDMLNPDAYHNAPNLGSKSDALRLEVERAAPLRGTVVVLSGWLIQA